MLHHQSNTLDDKKRRYNNVAICNQKENLNNETVMASCPQPQTN